MINRIRKIGKNRFVLFTILLALIHLAYYFLLRSNHIGYDAAFSDAFHNLFWVLVFFFILQRIHSFYHSRSAISIVHISTITIFSLLITLFTHWYGQWIGSTDKLYIDFLEHLFFVRWFILFLLLLTIVHQLWIDKHLKEQYLAYSRLIEKERQLAKAEMNNLQQQFQPHFLFNSLNSINALVKSQPENAREMILNLSDFLRKTIQKGKEDFNSLADEIDYLNLYMSIEKVRFGQRLQLEIEMDENCQNAQLPSLILQPLVENAIKFGLNGNLGAITIRLEIKCEENILSILISNPYDSSAVVNGNGTGYGLKSVERKLGIIYKRADLLSVKKTTTQFTVNLKIPQV
ncbi:MAG: histidine kinase [Flavobacteriales bacterium]|nr:histidine kinase [Flavobacteriales bacterium]